MTKKKKLTIAQAVKYYKAGYPGDSFCDIDYLKHRAVEAENVVKEITAFVYADTLEEACKCAVEFDYGVDGDGDASDWRNHVKFVSEVRKAAGHYELDYRAEGIIKDLLELVKDLNCCLNAEYYSEKEKLTLDQQLSYHKQIDKRIELAYGRLWED